MVCALKTEFPIRDFEMSNKGWCSNLVIFAFEQPLAIPIVPPVKKRDEGQKKVRIKSKDKQNLEN